MNENEYLVKTICEHIEQKVPIVLASIISLQGSSPRHSGTKMLISAKKNYGTIGGSLMEAATIKEAWTGLASENSSILEFDLAGKDASAAGMICGGKANILLDYIAPTESNKTFFRNWFEAARGSKDFYLLTFLKGTGQSFTVSGHSLFYPDGQVIGSNELTESDIGNLRSDLHNISSASTVISNDKRIVIDPIRKLKTLYCFGAGHVAVPTAKIAAMVGFRVVVIDDRAEFANKERFPEAYEVLVIDNFEHAFAGLEIDADSFIVIVTRGHMYDRIVLEQSLKTGAGYIGMISSRKKREAIYTALMSQGVSQESLEKVHSPIGIKIGGETPEEIAVSIVAELINERCNQQGAG
jgi:xanthine dehydrogenase accessory factor